MRLLDSLLRLLPHAFRDEFGREMQAMYEQESDAARARGRMRTLGLRLRTCQEMLALAARQHASDLARDLRHACRGLLRAPAFAAGAVLTLTLGIAPAVAMFSVLDAVVLRPLPYPNAERLVALWGTNPDRSARELPLSVPNAADLMASQQSLDALGIYAATSLTLTGGAEPERVRGALDAARPRPARGAARQQLRVGDRPFETGCRSSAGGVGAEHDRRVRGARQHGHGAQLPGYLSSLRDDVVGDTPAFLYVIAWSLGFVLLVACANVAGLMIVRIGNRERELAVRLTLGANRARLVRQLLVESLLLVGLGGACAFALARALLVIVQQSQALNLPRLAEARLDGRVLLFLFGVIACVAVALTIGGALRLGDADPARAIAGAGRSAGSKKATKTRGALVVAQFAFALVLLAGAALLLRSTAHLLSVNPGFSGERVLTFRVVLPAARYPEPAHRSAFYQQSAARLREIPGIEVAGSAAYAPMSGTFSSRRFSIMGRPVPPPGAEHFATDSPVGPGYFRAMGIPLVAGRPITERDQADAPPVVVVSETFARTHFPGASPVGRQIRFYSGRPGGLPPPPREIVGVVGDVRQRAVAEGPLPQIYVPQAQMPWGFGSFVLRVAPGRDPLTVTTTAKSAIAQIDPEQAPFDFRLVSDLVAEGSARHRTLSALLAGLALVALMLAAIGIYGIISTTVRARTQEIAVRVALGAQGRDVLAQLMLEGLKLAAIGATAGLAGASALTRLMGTLLFDVQPLDPLALSAGTATLLIVAAVACAWPARRALRLNAAEALRH